MKQKCVAFVLLIVLIVLPAQAHATAQQRVFWITYRSSSGPVGASLAYALERFQQLYPDVEVRFTQEPDEQWRAQDQGFMEADEVPDIFEPNTGTGMTGTYVRAGFLTDLTPIAEQRGWTGILNPTLQTVCRYTEQGIIGSGNLYGVITSSSFMIVYYNQNLFEQYGLDVPTSLEEFEQVADVFLAAGITPLTLGVADGLLDLNLYELMLYEADRAFVTNLQTFQGAVNFHGHEFTFGVEKLAEHFSRGYYGPDPLSVNYGAANDAFIQGQVPMFLQGTWEFGPFIDQIRDFEWGYFLMPGKELVTGGGGNLLAVPEKAKNKDLAYDFIDLALSPDAQLILANAGGISVAGAVLPIDNEKARELNDLFTRLVAEDRLAYWIDWPVPGYSWPLNSNLRELIAGNLTLIPALNHIREPYLAFKDSLR